MNPVIRVFNCTQYRDNPYQAMLFAPLAERFVAQRGTVEEALEARRRDPAVLLHVHWEEHILRGHATAVEARIALDFFLRALRAYKQAGGRIAWTIHNGLPHELEHVDAFIALRGVLAELADRILVHNTEAIEVLAQQVKLDRSKLFFLPHPSYLGIYEPEAAAEEAAETPPGQGLLVFGKMRRYKAVERVFETLSEPFLARLGATIELRGEPLAGDPYVAELQERYGARPDVLWDIRRIPDEEVPALMRAARCVMLPYERFLTSGVALLCISLGVPLVGPRTRALEEVLPVAAQAFLFDPDQPGDMARAVEELCALDAEAFVALRKACLDRARHFHPQRIGGLLGKVYNQMAEV
jgi:glycosyltransferase involved in cell wall biosynthesis